jgi:hypothetical protein
MELTTAELRAQVLDGYGGVCVVCGEDDVSLLQIDHVWGGGSQERKKIRGHRLYATLLRDGFPKHMQLLCVSCHYKKTRATNPDTSAPISPIVTGCEADPPDPQCRALEGVLQGVMERLDEIESRLHPVTDEGHGGLPALRTVTPTAVVFDTPALTEAWRLQQAALESAHHQIAVAQREVFERWMSRAVTVAITLLIGGGVIGVYALARWVFMPWA